LLLEHFFAQDQHAKRDDLAVEIFASVRKYQIERVVLARRQTVEDKFAGGIADVATNCPIKSVRAEKIHAMRLRPQGLARLRSPR
jgi:hypothetical protein